MHIISPWVLEHPSNISNQSWLIVTGAGFLLVVWLLMKFVVPLIGGMLTERQTSIAEAARQVKATLAETENMRNDYQARLEGIEEETKARMEEAIREANTLREQILEDAKRDVGAIVQRGHDEVSRERLKAQKDLKIQFVDDVIKAASFAAAGINDENMQRSLVDEFTRNVGTKT